VSLSKEEYHGLNKGIGWLMGLAIKEIISFCTMELFLLLDFSPLFVFSFES
jgi:hypothetical protein